MLLCAILIINSLDTCLLTVVLHVKYVCFHQFDSSAILLFSTTSVIGSFYLFRNQFIIRYVIGLFVSCDNCHPCCP